MVSAGGRDVAVRTEEVLVFLERPRLNMLAVRDVDEEMLAVSL